MTSKDSVVLAVGNRPEDASGSRIARKLFPVPRAWSFTEEERVNFYMATNPGYLAAQACINRAILSGDLDETE
jgi:hypothetical protein